MTKPQLGSLTNFNSVSNTVSAESVNRDMNLFHFGIPLTSLSENISYRTPFAIIQLSGMYIGLTEAAVKAFVDEIEGAAVSRQTQRNYTSGLNKTYQVKINNFTYSGVPGSTWIGWTMQLYDETI